LVEKTASAEVNSHNINFLTATNFVKLISTKINSVDMKILQKTPYSNNRQCLTLAA
jgi:hypothetical protein